VNGIPGWNASTRARITGLSGFDTETMISQLMMVEKIPLNSLYQKRTLVEWKQEAYRDIINILRGFKSTFFDVVNQSSYMLSKNAIKTMKATSDNSAYISVSATSDAEAASINVKVLQLATADSNTSLSSVSKPITGQVAFSEGVVAAAGKKITVNLDGISREITLADYTEENLSSTLQAQLDAAFGAGKITVGYDAGALTLGTTGGATRVTVSDPSSGESGLADLGLVPGASNRINLNSTLEALQNRLNVPLVFIGDQVEFIINGKTITASKDETLSEVFARINTDPDANATIKYDEVSDKVTLTSKRLGGGNLLTASDSGTNFLAALGVASGGETIHTDGKDAKILLNGVQEITRSTNTFTINGVSYTLKGVHPEDSEGDNVTVEQDVDKAFDNIKAFIDKYNELIDKLNGAINEKYDREYLPLTDEQKEAMKDSDIEKWEKKARTGLLRNDSILQNIVSRMRTALYEPVEGLSLTLKDIGISSNSYLDRGKLTIDENKLKDALRNNPDEVAKLLNGVDPDNATYKRSATAEQRASRYAKSGLFQRLSDIIEDNISGSRDTSGNKGILLEKAGIDNDASFGDNLLSDELKEYDRKIAAMRDKLIRKEEQYYRQFAAMESYLNQMSAQSAWLLSQFGSIQ
jgi:flagellar hook-associated protein 2